MADNELAAALANALRKDLPLTNEERKATGTHLPIVLNPGSFAGIAREKFRPGDLVWVEEDQANRLTRPSEYRRFPVARHLDEPEPDATGVALQVYGAGRYHPTSKSYSDPEAEPVIPGEFQVVTRGDQLAEPPGLLEGEGDPGDPPSTSPHGATPQKGRQPRKVGDGGKAAAEDEANKVKA